MERGGRILILGIDPGLAATGWGVIESAAGRMRYVDGGIIRTSPDALHISRLDEIRRGVDNAARRFRPQMAGVERVFANVNGKSSMSLGEARGAAIAALLGCDIGIVEISALQIKKSITGAGRADKKRVADMIPLLLQDSPPKPGADLSDALACALTAAPLSRSFVGNESHFRLPPIRKTRRRVRR